MRRGTLIAGVVVIVVGVLLLGLSFVFGSLSTTVPTPAAGTLTFSPSLIGSGTVSVSWSGATSAFRFSIHQCSDSACSQVQSTVLANGAGPSGSVSFTASGGTTYAVVSQGNGNAIPVTVQVSGLTFLLLFGIIVAALGAVIAFFGYRAKPKLRPAAAAAAPPEREMFSTKPFRDVQGDVASAFTPQDSERTRAEAPRPSGPVFFKPSEPEELYGTAPTPTAAPSKGPRPSVKCATCGTMNEPWVLNCRNCRRPMTSTGA